MTLQKLHRPKNPNGFEKFFKDATIKVQGPEFTIYAMQDTNPISAAFITKKLMPLSVDRHRLKRRIQELLVPYAEHYSVLVRLTKKTNAEVNLDWVKNTLEQQLSTQLLSSEPSCV